jgi:hypothetical protein
MASARCKCDGIESTVIAKAGRNRAMRAIVLLGLLALAGAASAATPTPTADRAIYRAAGFTFSKGA